MTTPTLHATLLGAAKAGTTSLYRYLAQHPELAAHEQREMAYFLDGESFAAPWPDAAAAFWPGASPGQRLLAKHVFFLLFDHGLDRLHAHAPNQRLIAVLRHPVDRAHSAYHYAVRRGWEDAPTFEAALDRETERLADRWAHRTELYRHTGEYATHLARVTQRFDQSQLHVVFTDELKADAAAACRACFAHLGVDPTFAPDLTRVHNPAQQARSAIASRAMARFFRSRGVLKRTARRLVPKRARHRLRYAAMALNESDAAHTPPPMDPATRAALLDHFAPHNDALAEGLGRPVPESWSR